MTNNDVSHDQELRAAVRRYQGRFEPAEADWAAIEARHSSRLAAGRRHHIVRSKARFHRSLSNLRAQWPWRKLRLSAVVAVPATAVAVLLIVANQPLVTVHVQQSDQATAAPSAPSYRPVTPRPVLPAGSTMAAIQARGFIRIGVKDDQPAFGLKDPATGAWSGFDIEMAKLMAAAIFGGDVANAGSKIVFVPVISAERESDIESGRVDIVIATYTMNAARSRLVDFAGPYFRAHQDIMVKADDTAINSAGDLNGRRVCTVSGSTSFKNLIAAASAAQITLLTTYSACAKQLAAGRVEAVTTDDVILAGLVHENGFIFKLINSPFSDEPYGIGLKHGDDTFRAFLDGRLGTIEADGDWALAESYALQGIQGFTPPPIAN